jgi:hypothetical protein
MEGFPVVQHLKYRVPEDRKYNQYQHARDWVEKSCMLPDKIPELDELNLWKLFTLCLQVMGSAFENMVVLCVIKQTTRQVCGM